VDGFVAQNLVFTDDKVAVAVLTNQEASAAAGAIARAVSGLVLPSTSPAATAASDAVQAEAQARQILGRFQQGAIDRAKSRPQPSLSQLTLTQTHR
jgi:D-alanyl-D-alanine carboxypeptidase